MTHEAVTDSIDAFHAALTFAVPPVSLSPPGTQCEPFCSVAFKDRHCESCAWKPRTETITLPPAGVLLVAEYFLHAPPPHSEQHRLPAFGSQRSWQANARPATSVTLARRPSAAQRIARSKRAPPRMCSHCLPRPPGGRAARAARDFWQLWAAARARDVSQASPVTRKQSNVRSSAAPWFAPLCSPRRQTRSIASAS